MTLGCYENFPQSIHRIDRFNSTFSSKRLQQKLIQVLHELNCREFSFEEVANPAVPQGRVIFEFGVAESEGFNFIDKEELEKALTFLSRTRLHSMDFFCSIRYYRLKGKKKMPLKFDYYMLRTLFSKNMVEFQVFHERGPRYLSPEELTEFIYVKMNKSSSKTKKILKRTTI